VSSGNGESPVRAGVVITGTEVLTGRVSDRNGPWVSQQLEQLGVEVAHILAVGDRREDLLSALRFCAGQGLDLVVTTGGLGPTADDITAEVVGEFAEREMVLDKGMEARIAEILAGFARRFRMDPEALKVANRKQAMVPEGATTVDPAGTAPGLVVDAGELTIIVMPGPPRELHAMWPYALEAGPVRKLLDRAPPFRLDEIRMFGIPESELAKSLREIEQDTDLSPLEITTCLRRAELVIDIRSRPGDEELADRVSRELVARHEAHVFSVEGRTIDQQVAELLAGHRIGVAESCTGGLLAGRLTDPPGASAYFAGGVVAYSNESKAEILGVPARLIETRGAVSPEVAEAMADGALRGFDADVACAITGVAGPDGGTAEKPVGYVCLCAKLADGTTLARDPRLPGGREDVRDRSVTVALHMLRWLLLGEEPPL
jgi:nicotinamide-nucleotide amidase